LRSSVAIPASVVTFTVHGIGPTARELDPDEDRTWVGVEQFDQLLDFAAGRQDIRITFDDGNASDVAIALPRLIERGLTAEFFVLAGMLGRPGRLDADGVRELARAGMSVGSHGWAHRDWRRIDREQSDEEFVQAHQVIGDLTGQPVSAVAVPFGSYDRHVLRKLRQANVTRVYTSDGGQTSSTRWLQPRTSLRHDIDAAWIARVAGGTAAFPMRARRLAARAVKRTRGKP